jgi:hypothetical protein
MKGNAPLWCGGSFLCLCLLTTAVVGETIGGRWAQPFRTEYRLSPTRRPPTLYQQEEFIEQFTAAQAGLAASDDALNPAVQDKTKINDLTSADTPDDTLPARMADLTSTVKDVVDKHRRDALLKAVPVIDQQIHRLRQAHRPFEPVVFVHDRGRTDELRTALAGYRKLVADLTDRRTALETAATDLDTAAQSIVPSAQRSIGHLTDSLADLYTTPADAAKDPLRKRLAAAFPRLPVVIGVRRALTPKWNDLSAALKSLKQPKITPPSDLPASLDARLSNILCRVPAWLNSLAKDLLDQNSHSETVVHHYIGDPKEEQAEAATEAKQDLDVSNDLSKINPAAADLLDQLQRTDLPAAVLPHGFAIGPLSDTVHSLGQSSSRLSVLLTMLQQPYPANLDRWVSDQFQLYYFDDVARLIQVLSTEAAIKGGQIGLSDKADAARAQLDQATQDLQQARQAVNDTRQEVAARQAALQTAVANDSAALKTATVDAARTVNGVETLKRRKSLADADLKLAKSEQDEAKAVRDQAKTDRDQAQTAGDPSLPQKQARLDAAQRRLDADDHRVDLTQRQTDGVSADLDQATTADTSAQTKLTNAKSQLDADQNEQTGLAAKVQQAQTAAQTAADKLGSATTTAFIDAQAENLAFARARDNVPFWASYPKPDDPDPLRRVILFGFPDSKLLFIRGDRTDVQRVKKMLASFDQPVSQSLLTLWSLEISSDGSPEGATKATKALQLVRNELAVSRIQSDSALDLLREVMAKQIDAARTAFDSEHNQATLLDREDQNISAFYDGEVLRRLGWPTTQDLISRREKPVFLRAHIPDPERLTTLAEALIRLSLAKRQYQLQIVREFCEQLSSRMQQDTQDAIPGYKPALPPAYRFANLIRFVGQDPTAAAGISSFQRELTDALQAELVERYTRDLKELVNRIVDLRAQLADPKLDRPRRASLCGELTNAMEDPLIPWYRVKLVLLSDESVVDYVKSRSAAQLLEDPLLFAGVSVGRARNARVAALNEMLKKYLQAVNDDLQAQIVQPMLDRLRGQLVNEAKVGVGVIQQTTVLASNRLVARVDPSASANLALGEEVNILQEATQLAQLVAAAETGGATSALGRITSTLGGVDRLPRDAPPGVYGVTTGNVFQVTPITDPTGQALRFRFDHVASTQIREPNGTANPQLSGIDRHGVNTEVQLSNHEIRLISQFDVNTRLGIAPRHSGGIPILKDIPGVKEIPLIGWFTLRQGHAAEVQQSLILAQTTMLPTIGDLVDLLR